MNHKPQYLGLNRAIFEDLIKHDCIYIDKTKIIYELITAPGAQQFYFISRPRRFGKSLFLSTLKSIFSGDKELFDQYWIGRQTNYPWPKHPVIHLDFSKIAHSNAQEFKQSICFALQKIATDHAIKKLKGVAPGDMLQDLVQTLQANGKIVLLIDEYDKPLVDHITKLPIAEENRTVLNNFYTTVKALEANWRAIFITGVSKFTKTSLFSGLNNIQELTFDPIAAELFGYTQEELITNFSPLIDNLAKNINRTKDETLDKMKHWYDGYRFSKDMTKQPMYSPLSVIASLHKKEFSNYWFDTGTPGFLIPLLRLKGEALEIPDIIQTPISSFNAFDIKDISIIALLVQTGYLTINDYNSNTGIFTLDYPNQEVRESFKNYLLQAFAYTNHGDIDMKLMLMRNAINLQNFENFFHAIRTLFAGIPYDKHIAREAYYHSLFHLTFDLLGMRPRSEEASSRGKADLVLETPDTITIFEFKYDSSAQKALDQILQKKYYEKYLNTNKTIILIGVNFDFKNKQLEFKWLQQNISKTINE